MSDEKAHLQHELDALMRASKGEGEEEEEEEEQRQDDVSY